MPSKTALLEEGKTQPSDEGRLERMDKEGAKKEITHTGDNLGIQL